MQNIGKYIAFFFMACSVCAYIYDYTMSSIVTFALLSLISYNTTFDIKFNAKKETKEKEEN